MAIDEQRGYFVGYDLDRHEVKKGYFFKVPKFTFPGSGKIKNHSA